MQDTFQDSPASAETCPPAADADAAQPRIFDRIGGWLLMSALSPLIFIFIGARLLYRAVSFDFTSIEFEYYSMTDVIVSAFVGIVFLAGWTTALVFAFRRDPRFVKLFIAMAIVTAGIAIAARMRSDDPLGERVSDAVVFAIIAAGASLYMLFSKRVIATFEGIPYTPTLTDENGQIRYLQALIWGANFTVVMIGLMVVALLGHRDWGDFSLRMLTRDIAVIAILAIAGGLFVPVAAAINFIRRKRGEDPSNYRL